MGLQSKELAPYNIGAPSYAQSIDLGYEWDEKDEAIMAVLNHEDSNSLD